MQGPSLIDSESRGIIPRTVAAIFEGVAVADPSIEFTIKVSYVEICESTPATSSCYQFESERETAVLPCSGASQTWSESVTCWTRSRRRTTCR